MPSLTEGQLRVLWLLAAALVGGGGGTAIGGWMKGDYPEISAKVAVLEDRAEQTGKRLERIEDKIDRLLDRSNGR